MKALNVILAVAGGVAVGAALGILFAPRSGSETREAVKDYIKSKCPGMKEKRLNALAEKITREIEEAE